MMEISLHRSKNLLYVLFDDDEFVEKDLEAGPFRRRYGCPGGVTFTFENGEKGFSLYISFDRYKDPEILGRVTKGQPVEELQTLWELAHLPCAKIFGSNVLLVDGRSVELVDTIGFELRKVMDGLWASGGTESEVARLNRQMKLNRLRDGLPRIFRQKGADEIVSSQAESPRGEVIFTIRRTGNKPGIQRNGMSHAERESASEHVIEAKDQKEAAPKRIFDPGKQPIDLPTEAEPQVDAPSVPEKRDPDEIAECDGCKKLYFERDLIEVGPEIWLCQFCRTSYPIAMALGLNPDKLPSLGNKKCDECGELLTKDELTEVAPGRWLCQTCILQM